MSSPNVGGLLGSFWVIPDIPDTSRLYAKEDQVPMTLDSPEISELIVFKTEILLGIPEKRFYFSPVTVGLEYPGRFPPDLIGGKVDRIFGKVFFVIADQDPNLTHPLEVDRLGKHLVNTLPDPDFSECRLGKGGGKILDLDVFTPDLDVPVRFEPRNPP